ncbi:hypothetical protein [Lonsdalea iberica]|uniref:Uncharacterized protein n=1 Tax=Lonsdalea iberica TaxID=1082703 RepID=A0A1X3RWN8_9GAMM|nr:hypothetical protein [Lonsdalea iberica]OSN06349.1 hypothetical protein AU511_07635 [Lonsdalea iberica]
MHQKIKTAFIEMIMVITDFYCGWMKYLTKRRRFQSANKREKMIFLLRTGPTSKKNGGAEDGGAAAFGSVNPK